MNAIEMLQAARKKIEKPENWRKGKSHVDSDTPKYSAFVALNQISPGGTTYMEAFMCLCKATGSVNNVVKFNDNIYTTHSDIMRLYDRAIKIAKEINHEKEKIKSKKETSTVCLHSRNL